MSLCRPPATTGWHRARRRSWRLQGRTAVGMAVAMLLLLPVSGCQGPPAPPEEAEPSVAETLVQLPRVPGEGETSLEELLSRRESVREFAPEALELKDVAAVLGAGAGFPADGLTGATGTVPSAGGTYAVDLTLVAGQVRGLEPGVYNYCAREHGLHATGAGDVREDLAAAANQDFVGQAPAVLIISGVYERTTATYGERGERYVHLEAGHVAQNVTLQAQARGLGTVLVGAFQDQEVQLFLAGGQQPLLLIPLGKTP